MEASLAPSFPIRRVLGDKSQYNKRRKEDTKAIFGGKERKMEAESKYIIYKVCPRRGYKLVLVVVFAYESQSVT